VRPDHSTVKRLAFIRYLYREGVSQSRGPSPYSCSSILLFHDAVELFLQLASEYLDAGSQRPKFLDYWDLLNARLEGTELGQKESMRRLNKARVALKHHGTFPSELNIESFRAATTNLLEDSTELVFGVSFKDISLIEYVDLETARMRLFAAQRHTQSGEVLEALDEIAVAFLELISDYEDRKRDRWQRSPFFFGKSMTFLNSFHMGIDRTGSPAERKIAEFVDGVKESVEAMQDAIKVLALGLDYRKYSRFKNLTPNVLRTASKGFRIQRQMRDPEEVSPEDVRFCLDFVVESAFALGEFDYSLNDITSGKHS